MSDYFWLMSWWLSHLLIDVIKRNDTLWSFLIDQLAHIVCIATVAYIAVYKVHCVVPLMDGDVINSVCLYALVFLLNGKPANLFIKHLLKAYRVQGPKESEGTDENIRSGKLIGNLERWIIIVFMLCGQYEAIGFLLAAKSIIRYKEGDVYKTEYVLAGTLISVFIAVVSGILLANFV